MSLPTIPIARVFEVQLGKMLDDAQNKGASFPYLANRDVQWGLCDISNLQMMRFTEEDRVRFSLHPCDLLVCEGGEVGRTAIWRGEVQDCYFQKAIHRLRPRRPTVPEFAMYYMLWAAQTGTFRRLTSATSIAHLTKEKLESAPFPDMGTSDQERIANILDTADTLRRKRQESLRLTDQLLRSVFLEMFGDPVTNPRGWPTDTLGQLITEGPTNGLYRPASDYGSGTPIVRIDSFHDGVVAEIGSLKRVRIEPSVAAKFALAPGQLLINRVNSPAYLGKSALVPALSEPTVFESNMMRLSIESTRAIPEFIVAQMQTPYFRQQIASRAKDASNQSSINQEDVRSFEVRLPPRASQLRYREAETRIRAQAEAMRRSAEDVDTLFNTLLHRAFTGEL